MLLFTFVGRPVHSSSLIVVTCLNSVSVYDLVSRLFPLLPEFIVAEVLYTNIKTNLLLLVVSLSLLVYSL